MRNILGIKNPNNRTVWLRCVNVKAVCLSLAKIKRKLIIVLNKNISVIAAGV